MPPAEHQVAWCNLPCRPSARHSTRGTELCPRLPRSKAGEMPARPLFPLRASLPAGARLAAGRSRPLTQAGSDRGGGETISAFGELWFGVLSCQRCVCDGLREEVKEGTHQGVTLFTKHRGTAEKKTSLWAPVLRDCCSVSAMRVHLSDLPRKVLTNHELQAFTVL